MESPTKKIHGKVLDLAEKVENKSFCCLRSIAAATRTTTTTTATTASAATTAKRAFAHTVRSSAQVAKSGFRRQTSSPVSAPGLRCAKVATGAKPSPRHDAGVPDTCVGGEGGGKHALG